MSDSWTSQFSTGGRERVRLVAVEWIKAAERKREKNKRFQNDSEEIKYLNNNKMKENKEKSSKLHDLHFPLLLQKRRWNMQMIIAQREMGIKDQNYTWSLADFDQHRFLVREYQYLTFLSVPTEAAAYASNIQCRKWSCCDFLACAPKNVAQNELVSFLCLESTAKTYWMQFHP